jgi:hypothetical protein
MGTMGFLSGLLTPPDIQPLVPLQYESDKVDYITPVLIVAILVAMGGLFYFVNKK